MTLIEMYLCYVNDFITVQGFADYFDLPYKTALRIISWGKKRNNR